jgi:hypothetical protein
MKSKWIAAATDDDADDRSRKKGSFRNYGKSDRDADDKPAKKKRRTPPPAAGIVEEMNEPQMY